VPNFVSLFRDFGTNFRPNFARNASGRLALADIELNQKKQISLLYFATSVPNFARNASGRLALAGIELNQKRLFLFLYFAALVQNFGQISREMRVALGPGRY